MGAKNEYIQGNENDNKDDNNEDSSGVQFYNQAEAHRSLENFRKFLSYQNIIDIPNSAYDGIFSWDMKNRNEGSTNPERKSKSLVQRWFSKNKYKDDKEKTKWYK